MAMVSVSSSVSSLSRLKPFVSSSITPSTLRRDLVDVRTAKPPSLSSIGGTTTANAAAGQRTRTVQCTVASTSDFATQFDDPPSQEAAPSMSEEDEESNRAAAAAATDKVGARVRIKAPLKVFHVPKVPEVDLTGMEGTLKQYVGLWKGTRLSANLPFRVEFVTDIEGRGSVKFFSHLKEDEFEFV